MSLALFQQQMLQAVLTDEPRPLDALRSDALADVDSRLAIYRHGYRVRLRDSLATEFPALGKLAGRRFNAMLDAYIQAHPSSHYNIRWHGIGLTDFLGRVDPWRASPELAEIASFDWAISTAFDAADEPLLAPADLATLPPEAWAHLCLRPQAHLQVISAHYDVAGLRRATDRGEALPRRRATKVARHFLVWRQALSVHYRAIDADELSALGSAMAGQPFAFLCENLSQFHQGPAAMNRMASLLQQWLGNGLLAGWSVRRPEVAPNPM